MLLELIEQVAPAGHERAVVAVTRRKLRRFIE
jgi:putative aminopeptidase FrvX